MPVKEISTSSVRTSKGATEQIETMRHGVGKWFLRDIWYYAYSGKKLKPGQMVPKTILGEQLLIGRDKTGKVFAVSDICPHQAVPFSKGHFDGCQLKCPFHGWKFSTDGVCTEIPSLVSGQDMDVSRIKVRAYPCEEVQGNIWVYISSPDSNAISASPPQVALPPIPKAPGIEGAEFSQYTVTLLIPTHIDYAAAALIDPAHVPYVHNAWWWRSTKNMREKAKKYIPSQFGWTIVKHQPSAHSMAYKLIGKHIEDEISFCLPGCRREYLTFQGKTFLAGLSALTPIDETHTELNHTTYWSPAGTEFISPVIDYFVRTFLGQDLTIAEMQEHCLKANPKLIMTIKDAGTPGHWYFRLKDEWALAKSQNREFVNPVKESILRWRS